MIQMPNTIAIENLFEQVINNPCLPYFFIDLMNGNYLDFCKSIEVDGEFKKIADDVSEYIKRLKSLKSHYLAFDYSSTREFLSDKENLELVLIYFTKELSNLINLYPYEVLVLIYNYLNFNNSKNV